MAGSGVASNQWLSDRINQAVTDINTGHVLRLFKNNFTPTPGSLYTDFVESTFGGYSTLSFTGSFATPVLIIPGEYQSSGPTWSFSWASGPDEVCYGWWITKGTTWKLAQVLPSPFTFTSGATLQLIIRIQDWALSIVP